MFDLSRKRKESYLEDQFNQQLIERGVEGFTRNTLFIKGRKFKADFWFPELKLAIEVDGGLWKPNTGHTSGKGSHSDRERDICGYLTDGILTFRVGTDHLKDDTAIDWVLEIIKRRKEELNVR